MSERPGYVYRAFDAEGTLLYVGATINPSPRLGAHQSHAEWWPEATTISIQRHASRRAALDAEEEALLSEGPKYNIRTRHGVLDIKRYHARLDELERRRSEAPRSAA